MTSYSRDYLEQYSAANGGAFPPSLPMAGGVPLGNQIGNVLANPNSGNTRTASEVQNWLKSNGVQTGLNEADTMSAINSNPALKQQWTRFASNAAPQAAAAPQGGGIVPITVEPRHQFERDALTALGTGTVGTSDPRVSGMIDNFSKYSGQSADLLTKGASGFNQSEFDSYVNPHTEAVTDRSVARLSDQAADMKAQLLRQMASGRGNATFGDLYGAQALGDIDSEFIKSSGDIIAQGNEAGFNTALEALFRQRGNELSAGSTMGQLAGQQLQGAQATQGIIGSEIEQGLTQLGAQLGAGTNIREFNQNTADLAFQNQIEPILQGNAVTDSAINSFTGTQGGVTTVQPTGTSFNRFGNIAQGVSGIAQTINGIKF